MSESDPEVLDTLAASYAETGQFTKAIATANRALDLAVAKANHPLVAAIRSRLVLYAAKSPFRAERKTAAAYHATAGLK
jgi:hypothetical protein